MLAQEALIAQPSARRLGIALERQDSALVLPTQRNAPARVVSVPEEAKVCSARVAAMVRSALVPPARDPMAAQVYSDQAAVTRRNGPPARLSRGQRMLLSSGRLAARRVTRSKAWIQGDSRSTADAQAALRQRTQAQAGKPPRVAVEVAVGRGLAVAAQAAAVAVAGVVDAGAR